MTQCQVDLKIITKAVQRQSEQREQSSDQQPDSGTNATFFPGSRNIRIDNSYFTINQSINQTPVVENIDDYEDRAHSVKLVLEGMELRYKSLAPPHIINKILELIGKVHPAGLTTDIPPVRQDTVITLVDITPVIRPMFAYGNVPLMSMAAGVATLAISTILLTVASELIKTEVWISCVGALVGVMTLSFLPSSWILKLFATRKSS